MNLIKNEGYAWKAIFLFILPIVALVKKRDVRTDNTVWPRYHIYYPFEFSRLDFEVKCGHDAWIALTSDLEVSEPNFDILIGGFGNKENHIIKNQFDKLVENKEAGLLGASEYRGFWIAVDHKYNGTLEDEVGVLRIRVGRRGHTEPFMEWIDDDTIAINYFSFATTGADFHGYWRFSSESDGEPALRETIDVQTNNTRLANYTKFFKINREDLILFRVWSGHDAWIALVPEKNSANKYEVLLGGWANTRNLIFKNNKALNTTYGSVLDLKNYRAFWIKLEYIKIKKQIHKYDITFSVGVAGVDTPFLTATDTDALHHIEYFSVATTGADVHGYWYLLRVPTESFPLDVQTTNTVWPDYDLFYPISGKEIHFRVWAGHDAWIILSSSNMVSNPKIEILLGGYQNTRSEIVKNGTETQVKHVGAILNAADYAGFWIKLDRTFTDEVEDNKPALLIRVGLANNDKPFLSWKEAELLNANFFGVATTGSDNHGYWKLNIEKGIPVPAIKETFDIKTDNTEQPSYIKYYPVKTKSIHFKVRCGHDAWIALVPSIDTSSKIATKIEILLGGYENTRSEIVLNSDTKFQHMEQNIVDSTVFRGFWIEWEYISDELDFGKAVMIIKVGKEGQTEPFMTWKNDKPFSINYFSSATTGRDSHGFWKLDVPGGAIEKEESQCTSLLTAVSSFLNNTVDPCDPMITKKECITNDEDEESLRRYSFDKANIVCEVLNWSTSEKCKHLPSNVFSYEEDCKSVCVNPKLRK